MANKKSPKLWWSNSNNNNKMRICSCENISAIRRLFSLFFALGYAWIPRRKFNYCNGRQLHSRAKCVLDGKISFSLNFSLPGHEFFFARNLKPVFPLCNFVQHLEAPTSTSPQPWPLLESMAVNIWLCFPYGCFLSAEQDLCSRCIRTECCWDPIWLSLGLGPDVPKHSIITLNVNGNCCTS